MKMIILLISRDCHPASYLELSRLGHINSATNSPYSLLLLDLLDHPDYLMEYDV